MAIKVAVKEALGNKKKKAEGGEDDKPQSIPVVTKWNSMQLHTIDNLEIHLGLIVEEAHLKVVIDEHAETLVFNVADIGDNSLILEVNWLWCHNPTID
ncbi:hypothetical protein H2248_012488 [Termitomyces sp. 'cryptogamus']|nr:hypothetical protein H2248_012488 [Termitomyces sp. 'cryptogamus']